MAIGDAAWRGEVAAHAWSSAAGLARVVDVVPPARWTAWGGVAALVAALDVPVRSLTPRHAAALQAVTDGGPVGDHLGVGVDVLEFFRVAASEGPVRLIVHDAHRWDLGSAGALSHACSGLDGIEIAVLVTQQPSPRGVTGLDTVRQHGAADGGEADAAADRTPSDTADRVLRDGRVASALDVADALETFGDWTGAAGQWLSGGRPDRARRALQRAVDDPAAAGVRARLALRTESTRAGVAAVLDAAAALEPHAPASAGRLRLQLLLGALNRGDTALRDQVIDETAAGLCDAPRSIDSTTCRELLSIGRAMVDVAGGGDPGELLESAERPLARMAEGGTDAEVVAMVSASAMVLAWRGALEEARSVLDRVVATLDNRGALLALPMPLATSAWLARRQGRLDLARADGLRALELARSSGAVNDGRFALVEVAHVEAMQGRLEECRAHVEELIPPGTEPVGPVQLGATTALAVAELLAGEPGRAAELLEAVHVRFAASVGPRQVAWRHNLVEAYARTGRRAEAAEVLADLEEWVGREDPVSDRSAGELALARAMLASGGGYDRYFEEALCRLTAYPGLRWRAGFQYVCRLLEDGRRAEAEPLGGELLDTSDGAGVAAGADRLRRLLVGHGIPVRRRPPAATSLSLAHLRIAMLLAEGAADADIAEQLRLSRATVAGARRRIMDALEVDDVGDLGDRLVGRSEVESVKRPTAATVVLFGPLAVRRGADRSTPPAGHPSTLLALVALHGVLHVEQVLDVLWPEAAIDEGRARLRNVLTRLRRSVGDVIVRDRDLLRVADGVDVDSRRFVELADAARRSEPPERDALVVDALSNWGGEPLAAFLYDDWAIRARDRLRATHVELLEARARSLLDAGRPSDASAVLEEALGSHSYQEEERLWSAAIRAADIGGRTDHARHVRARARAALADPAFEP